MDDRRKALVNLLGSALLLIPCCAVLFYQSLPFVADSWAVSKAPKTAAALEAVYLLKNCYSPVLRAAVFASPSHHSPQRANPPHPMSEFAPLAMFFCTFAVLLSGFPVAFCLAGTALGFAGLGVLTGDFDAAFLSALPARIYGIMSNETLMAVPLFVFMGVVLERSKIAEELLETMAQLCGSLGGGLGISVCLVGGLLAASTGIVGATVVTMGLISLPAMLKRAYSPAVSTGIICASGTLGQIIRRALCWSSSATWSPRRTSRAQLKMGNFAPVSVSVGDLFMGALVPGFVLMSLYILYIIGLGLLKPSTVPAVPAEERAQILSATFLRRLGAALVPPLVLICGVLGSILFGVATPTEAASVGAVGAMLLSLAKGHFNRTALKEVMRTTTEINAMVFIILIGASVFFAGLSRLRGRRSSRGLSDP